MPFRSLSLRAALLASLIVPVFALPSAAELAGAYLAARAATTNNDYASAAGYYQELLRDTPDNRDVQDGALITQLALGDYEHAATLAEVMLKLKDPSQIAVLAGLADAAKDNDFPRGSKLLDDGAEAGDLVAGLYRAWAHVATGQMAEAGRAFDKVAKLRGLEGFSAYHKALSLAMVGDYEGADKILSGPQAKLIHTTRRGILAHVEVLSQLERGKDALDLLDKTFGVNLDPELSAVRARLAAGETVPFTLVKSAQDGVAEIFFAVAQAINSEATSTLALVHARLALWLRPDFPDAALLTAATFEAQGQDELAIGTYALVSPQSAVFPAAELGRSEALVNLGRTDEAIAALEALGRSHATLPAVWASLGDNLRREERFAEAATAYDKGIALIATPTERDWFLFFARGIAESRSDQWDKAEKDFRQSLALSPDQPAVLNYLGYSYVERKENLDEALSMIERAVAARPDEGYIIDSLGWALFRLGRYDDAVKQMEKAVELDPSEPLLNDHLGDIYWAVGRKREAEFQWRRALSYGPGEDLDMDRVHRKLDIGLDAVLKEEGGEPLHSNHAPD